MNKQDKRDLFSEFKPVSRKEWEDLIRKDLKGVDYKKKLRWNTLEGVKPLPFYMSEDLDPNEIISIKTLRKSDSKNWARCVPINAPKPKEANGQIADAIKGGANSFRVTCDIRHSDGQIGGNMIGTQLQSQSDVDTLFQNLDMSGKTVLFESGMNTPAIQAMLLNSDIQPEQTLFSFDPFTYVAKHGRYPLEQQSLNNLLKQIDTPNSGKSFLADGLFYHSAGATIVQELGISLAIASEYLARSKDSAESIFFRLSAGPLYFPEIAKFRAARILWANLLDAYGLDTGTPAIIHTETTLQNQTVADPHNNILRATTETMAAVFGGVNSILIHPHDHLFENQNEFSSRIARNIHHIVDQESHLGEVSDPAAGSYYIEKLTEEIANEAWDFFKLIEKQGGFIKALKNRVIQSEVSAAKDQKLKAYATGKRTLVGTNNYPNSEEKLPDTVISTTFTDALPSTDNDVSIEFDALIASLSEALKQGATVGDLFHSYLNPQKVLLTTLEPFRAGELFEEIRKQTQLLDKKPIVQLIPVGNKKWRKLRESFAHNLLGCAGFEIQTSLGYNSISEAADNLSEKPGDIYVLCSSDTDYPGLVDEFSELFSNRGLLVIAGKPGENESAYRDAGIEHFIYTGINIPDFLQTMLDELEPSNYSS
ncbi:methylmalonyl-CoA mutase family protein [Rhodohalobacter halophilus]|uniref:methylmalonyl-CoA mutase family protein n=1 Tax=Rhodohalobacter halophilus TaxID=1812810 RepID=UPI00083F827B|nr:methylmalonyl-CoA mutase family protein [Rhodohalobacter halophilus]